MNRKSSNATTQRAVDEAADKLLVSGIRPTVQRLHEAIGGVPRELRPMLEDWRNRLAQRSPVGSRPSAAIEREERAEQLVRQAIDTVRGSLRDRIRTSRKRIASMSRPLVGNRADRISRSDVVRLGRELTALQSQIAAQRKMLDEACAAAASLEKRTTELVRSVRLLSATAKR